MKLLLLTFQFLFYGNWKSVSKRKIVTDESITFCYIWDCEYSYSGRKFHLNWCHCKTPSWSNFYLTHRTQSVLTNGNHPRHKSNQRGVPQSAVFDTMLFVICLMPFIELIGSLEVNHHIFADKVILFSSIECRSPADSIHIVDCVFKQVYWLTSAFKRNDVKSARTQCM